MGSLSALATTCCWVFLGLTVKSALATRTELEVQLAELEEAMRMPLAELGGSPMPNTTIWYSAWAVDLHARLDELFLALEQRPSKPANGTEASPSLEMDEEGGEVFTIAFVGDSTLRMQGDAFAWLLTSLRTEDGRRQCHCRYNPTACTCSKADVKGEDTIALRLDTYKVLEECVNTTVSADFVYFGCGLHILPLEPARAVNAIILDSWIHYERKLEDAVLGYRANKGKRRGYIGEAFMTIHSFTEDTLVDPFLGLMLKYRAKDHDVLSACVEKVRSLDLLNDEWEMEFAVEDICTRGNFGEQGVIELNIRGQAVMERLGVPIVQGYDITRRQAWATPSQDGRHYPALIPQELSHFLAKINLGLLQERLRYSR